MRSEFPRKIRLAAIKRADGKCEKCGANLKAGKAEVDHVLPDILGGEPTLANAQVLCGPCHKEKTAADVRRTRKADRQRDKNNGAWKPPAKKMQGRSFTKTDKPRKIDKKAIEAAALPRTGGLARQYQEG